MNLYSTPTLPAHRWVIGMDNVRRACWRPISGLVGAAIFASLLCGFVEPVRADVVIAPTALTIGIPTGQTTAWGSITARNTAAAPVTITWNDAVHCLQNLTPLTRTLAAGASSTFTIQGVCPATGSATLSGTGVPMVTIPVSITTLAPAIGLNTTSLGFAGTVGGINPSAQTIGISNVGSDTLIWSASSSAAWLTLGPVSGTNAGTVTATAKVAGLLSGSYSAMVTVTATGATTKMVPVTLTVTGSTSSGTIGFSPANLAFAGTVGGTNPAAQPFALTNTGGGTLSWTVSDNATWLQLNTAAGTTTTETDTISASVTASGLAAGTYNAIITVTASGSTNGPRQIPVSLTLGSTTAGTVGLAWKAHGEADLSGYKVYQGTSSGAYVAPVATLPKTTTSHTVTGLQTGTTYFFVITAYDTAGNESPPSSEVSKSIF